MKNLFIPILCILVNTIFAQDYYLELQEIIHNSSEDYTDPYSFRADENGGSFEFKVVYYVSGKACPETFRFSWGFDQNMKTLTGKNGEEKKFPFFIHTERLSGNCGEVNPWRNPTGRASSDNGGWSRIINSPNYKNLKYVKSFSTLVEIPYLYFRPDKSVRESSQRKTGRLNGSFSLKQWDTYDGRYAYFHFPFSGGSNRNGVPEQGMNYEIVYLFKIMAGKPPANTPSTTATPCDIQAPDCSSYPGTIPVWNFKTNRPDCMCREGKVWDKLLKKCVDAF